MFDVAPTELLLVAVVALLVIGPKDLPKAMRFVGHWVGRARGVARQFRSGFDTMVREAELQDMEKRWAEENERIMREHPPLAAQPMVPLPAPATIDHEEAPPVMTAMPVIADVSGSEAIPEPAIAEPEPPKPPRKRRSSKIDP